MAKDAALDVENLTQVQTEEFFVTKEEEKSTRKLQVTGRSASGNNIHYYIKKLHDKVVCNHFILNTPWLSKSFSRSSCSWRA